MSSAFQSNVVLHMYYHVGACMANVRPVFHQYIAGVISEAYESMPEEIRNLAQDGKE